MAKKKYVEGYGLTMSDYKEFYKMRKGKLPKIEKGVFIGFEKMPHPKRAKTYME